MQSFPFQSDADLRDMQALVRRLGARSTTVDFHEKIQMASVRAATRLWRQNGQLLAFAYVDDFNNLWFDTAPEADLDALEDEIVAWGEACIRKLNLESGEANTLDFSCGPQDARRLDLMRRHGFAQESVRSLHYRRPLTAPVADLPFPAGYSWRCVDARDPLEALVDLHRAAFGTDNMTVEERLAIMHAPNYLPALDLLALAPDGSLAAFCICGFEEPGSTTGYTDPIGTHPGHQRLGLARALVTCGLRLLQQNGADTAELGTSSQNIPMQKLAESLGFVCVSEKLWFSKEVD